MVFWLRSLFSVIESNGLHSLVIEEFTVASKIAVQGYTLRDFAKTPEDVAKTCARIRKIGYEAVQISAWCKMDPNEMAKILKNEGLTCAATHVGLDEVLANPQKIADEHKILGCSQTAVGSLPGLWDKSIPKDMPRFKKAAADMSDAAKKLAALGIGFGYHNHKIEFQKCEGRRILDILIEESDPALNFEIDTFWVQFGGADPAEYIKRLKGRIPLLHLKDLTIVDDNVTMAEVGEGNLNWPAILKAAKSSGVKWYIVEEDVCQRDPFESIEISLKNLKAMGVK